MRPGGRDVPRLHTGNESPPRNALPQERCTRSPALRPRGIVSPRRPLDFGCGRIGPSTPQSTYPQGIIPRKDDPPRFGCSPPTAGGTSRTPAKCTPRIAFALRPIRQRRLKTPEPPAPIQTERNRIIPPPHACRTRRRPVMAAADEASFAWKARASLPRRNTRRAAAVSGAPLPHF